MDPNCAWQKPEKTDSFFDTYRDGNQTNSNPMSGPTPGAATGGFSAGAGRAARKSDGARGWTTGVGRWPGLRRSRGRPSRGPARRRETALSLARGARRAAPVLGLVAAVILFAGPARAQSDILEEATTEAPFGKRYRSPQNFAFEVKFGPYRPDVDSEFDQGGVQLRHRPTKDYFSNSRHLYSQIELDWQILHKFGSLALGVGIGYFSVTGIAPLGDGTGLLSGDTSNFKVIPISGSVVYRFDRLLEDRNIPLVPYAKAGLDWAYWQITDGNGEIARDPMGNSGRGGTLGWHASAGFALVLDWLDPDAARDFDADLGVNHTALTFEYTHADISGLGQANRLHVGDTTWALGLLLEF